MEGKRAAFERQQDLIMSAAWFAAAMPLMKKFPKHADLMVSRKPAKALEAQSATEMLGAMRAWAQATKH